jgi:hypothetical protein
MRFKRPSFQRKQQTSQELLDDLLGFLERKFYEGHRIEFLKDRRRLLDWVVLWPATWLHEKGVTLPDDRYRQIFMKVFMTALQMGDTGNIKYLPAWLAKCIQSHFAVHGDDIYDAAKSMRTLTEHALLSAGKAAVGRPDPVRELAVAARLVKAAKPARKPTQKEQLSLL